jgi:hypothetical protein
MKHFFLNLFYRLQAWRYGQDYATVEAHFAQLEAAMRDKERAA